MKAPDETVYEEFIFRKTKDNWNLSMLTCDGQMPMNEALKEIIAFCEQSIGEERDYKKPPLGVMPKWLWQERRCEELRKCINRHFEANWLINIELVDEYNSHVKELEHRKTCP